MSGADFILSLYLCSAGRHREHHSLAARHPSPRLPGHLQGAPRSRAGSARRSHSCAGTALEGACHGLGYRRGRVCDVMRPRGWPGPSGAGAAAARGRPHGSGSPGSWIPREWEKMLAACWPAVGTLKCYYMLNVFERGRGPASGTRDRILDFGDKNNVKQCHIMSGLCHSGVLETTRNRCISGIW